ncbi:MULTISPECIES: hypothetical protein [unclassified Streptomyces]|uniref:hypothetical protein n=1 Tax=unclassified Streptomyces TaxID=2593676 RepID=UPI000DC77E50|nr:MULTISPECIES: hypothetical protein [unclassified Streptomyces]AWZ04478.1 hypothetical protein DRB89_07330 [Streptomyces sp. ICC4]AWZ12128.1 hypothetical protein DRB96_07125 [Streptomyces sp. ICC1]
MQREGPYGRDDEYAEPEPAGETLSTEDIARPQTDTSQQTADDGLTAVPEDEGAAPRTRVTDDSGGEPDAVPGEQDGSEREPDTAPLLGAQQAEDLRIRWQQIQQGFVDDPKQSVLAADGLVAEVMQLLATTFADHKQGLEGQWHRGEEVATEDLRLALRQYRSFFDRLLST